MYTIWRFFCMVVLCGAPFNVPTPEETPIVVHVQDPAPVAEPSEGASGTIPPEPSPSPSEVPSAATVGPSRGEVDTSVWDEVALCESNGDWDIHPSDSPSNYNFYGGLQFSQQSWIGAGGGRYASRADLASKEEQVAVARRLLAMQGPSAWPNCGPKAGLKRKSGGATMEYVVG